MSAGSCRHHRPQHGCRPGRLARKVVTPRQILGGIGLLRIEPERDFELRPGVLSQPLGQQDRAQRRPALRGPGLQLARTGATPRPRRRAGPFACSRLPRRSVLPRRGEAASRGPRSRRAAFRIVVRSHPLPCAESASRRASGGVCAETVEKRSKIGTRNPGSRSIADRLEQCPEGWCGAVADFCETAGQIGGFFARARAVSSMRPASLRSPRQASNAPCKRKARPHSGQRDSASRNITAASTTFPSRSSAAALTKSEACNGAAWSAISAAAV